MILLCVLALSVLLQPTIATVTVVPSVATLLRSATSISFTAINDGTGPFTWTSSLAATDFSGATGGACSVVGSPNCTTFDCVQQGASTTFV